MIKQAKVYRTPGIYKILNRVNGDFYIGSSMNCYKRMYQHQTLLRNNRHHAYHLQHAWNKYGQENFEYLVLEYVNTEDEKYLRFVEQQYLDLWMPVYNVSRDAVSPLSTKYVSRSSSHTFKVLPQNKPSWKDTKLKISNTVKSLWMDDEYREYQISCMNSQEAKQNYSDSMKKRYSNSEYKDGVRKSILESFSLGKNKTSKFSKDDILSIRELASRGMNIRELSNVYESNPKTIRRIVNRETWNFV